MASKETRALLIYLNNREVLEALDDAERGQLTLALLDYLEYGSLPAFTGALGMAFLVLRKDVDRSVERWEEECARRSAAGKKSAALRAAKKFTPDVSCNSDIIEEAESEAPLNDPEQLSTALNPVEDCAAERTYTNPNPNTNPYTNTNSYTNTKTHTSAITGTRRGAEASLLSEEAAGASRERDFGRFWAAYPKKVGKQAARKAFLRADAPLDTLLSALERQRGEPQWQRENGRYIPHPVTWLNQARWEDEPAAPVANTNMYGIECL